MNQLAIGICVVGNYDDAPPSPERIDLLSSLIRDLQYAYKIPKDNVIGHRDYAPYKTCPGKSFALDMIRDFL